MFPSQKLFTSLRVTSRLYPCVGSCLRALKPQLKMEYIIPQLLSPKPSQLHQVPPGATALGVWAGNRGRKGLGSAGLVRGVQGAHMVVLREQTFA